jgi:hypothetical protein
MGRRWETWCFFGPAFCLSDSILFEVFEHYCQCCALCSHWRMALLEAFVPHCYSEAVTVALSCTLFIYPLTTERQCNTTVLHGPFPIVINVIATMLENLEIS